MMVHCYPYKKEETTKTYYNIFIMKLHHVPLFWLKTISCTHGPTVSYWPKPAPCGPLWDVLFLSNGATKTWSKWQVLRKTCILASDFVGNGWFTLQDGSCMDFLKRKTRHPLIFRLFRSGAHRIPQKVTATPLVQMNQGQ